MTRSRQPFLESAFAALLVGGLISAIPLSASAEGAYVTDSEGRPVLSASGGCVHTGAWNNSMPTCPEPTLIVEEGQTKIDFAVDDAEFFGFDQVKLSNHLKADLDAVVGAVESADMIHGITITGHSDQIGPAPYNEQLALRRAEAVKSYLVAKGIPADRIQTLSDGSSTPLVICPNIKNQRELIRCLAPNRRVDVQALLADNVDIANVALAPPGE